MHQYVFKPENVRTKRKALSMSVHDLGSAAGVDGAAISRIEHGERNPGADILGRLAGALKVSPNYFFEKVSIPVRERPSAAPDHPDVRRDPPAKDEPRNPIEVLHDA